MSIKEKIIETVSSMTEEQAKQLAEFINGFGFNDTRTPEQIKADEEADLAKRREAFKALNESIKKYAHLYADIGDNDKELIAEAIMEKYNSI